MFFSLTVLTGRTNICRLAFSLLYRSIQSFNRCVAHRKKEEPLSLDIVTSEGSLAFDTLETAVHTIGSLGECNFSNLSFVLKLTKREG